MGACSLDLRVMGGVLVSAIVVFVLLYTTFLTNPRGVITGTVGGLSYWFAQQEVKRASQPWYYYLIIAPLYEFLPIGLGLTAMAYYVRRKEQGSATQHVLVAYLIYWTLSAWLIYSWAGEKMPWMMVHIIQPMIVLSGRFLDDVFGTVRRRVFCAKGAIWLVVVCTLLLVTGAMVVLLPLVGSAFQEREDTLSWVCVLLASVTLAVVAHKLWVRVGRSMGWRAILAAGVGLGMVLTVRYAWMANYINHDTAREFLVYSHGAPGAKQTVHEIREISRQLYGDPEAIRLAYGADGTCPFEWYFSRYFPNRVFFGEEPSRQTTDVPVLVVGQPEISKVEPYLGNRYLRFDRKYLWFPHQAYYMNLSLAIPRKEEREPGKNYFLLDMLDPVKRRAFWSVLFYRQYDETDADWDLPAQASLRSTFVRTLRSSYGVLVRCR